MALIRGIGRGHLVALTVNCVVGAGILGLPSKVYGLLGGWTLAGWVAAALVASAVAASLAEVGSRFTATGGAYLYARTTFGPLTGFLTGWLSLVTRIVAFASVCNLLVAYAAAFVPAVATGPGRVALVTGVIALLSTVLAVGIRQTAWLGTAITLLKVGLLLSVVVAGLARAPAATIPPLGPLPDPGDFAAASLLMLFAFAGFEAAAVPTGEVRDPPRDLPFAIAAGMTTIVAIYLLVQGVCIAALPGLAASERPVADVAAAALGPRAGAFVGAGACAMLTGSLLTQLLGASRMAFAMAEDRELPRALASVHPTTRTPLVAIALTGLAAWLATVTSSFVTAVAVTVATRVLTYLVICAALPALRRRPDAPSAGFRLPFGEAVALAGGLASAALLGAASARELATAAGLAVAGLAARGVARR